MDQDATIKFKSLIANRKRKVAVRKCLIGALVVFAIVPAGFFGWRYFEHSKLASAIRTLRAAKAPATVKPALAANSAKTDNHSSIAKIEQPVAAKAATPDFADSMMAVLLPSAKGATIQQEMPLGPKPAAGTALPAKRIPLKAAAAPLSVQKPQVLTAEQKRLQVAQDGFGHVMDRAIQHPGAYGFLPDESLGDAKLGDEIPVYTIKLQGRDKSTEQTVSSLLKPANEWLYPIILEGHVRFMVQVRLDGNDYVLENGSRALAMNYDKILANWPADKGFHPKLITVPGLPSYYFTIPELPDQNITDTSRMLDYNPSVSPASIVLADLQ